MPDPLRSKIDPSVLTGSLERKQRNRMVLAVLLLMMAVSVVVLKDRNRASHLKNLATSSAVNVVPSAGTPVRVARSQDAQDSNLHVAPNQAVPPQETLPRPHNVPAPDDARPNSVAHSSKLASTSGTRHRSVPPMSAPSTPLKAAEPDSGAATNLPGVTATRAVLPPLRVEVVAGDRHHPVKPGDPSLKVDMQPESPAQPAPASQGDTGSADSAPLTDASERVQVSADTAQVLTHRVRPEYPLLARQMKVQGSVVLDAMIGKDGGIQNLHVVQGPTILADAAREAVRQWRFKPYLQDGQAVETQAHITVNFMISTN